jgi:DNA-binding CsgD family transcriptional regulator
MVHRTRINYTPTQKTEMWDRWQRGETLNTIGRVFDRSSSSIFGQLSPTGGIRPPPRQRAKSALTLREREEISRGTVGSLSLRNIAKELGRSPSTISREINRNGGLKAYRASEAEQSA